MNYKTSVSLAILASIILSTPISAFTGDELMNKFDENDRIVYVTGMVDAISYQHVLGDEEARARCILDWFYKADLGAMSELEQAFGRFPDRDAVVVTIALSDRRCPPN